MARPVQANDIQIRNTEDFTCVGGPNYPIHLGIPQWRSLVKAKVEGIENLGENEKMS